MNNEHQLKSKLAWPVWQHNMKLKQKWYSSNDYSKKWHFYWVVTWKVLFSEGGGDLLLGGESNGLMGRVFQVRGGWTNFWLVGALPQCILCIYIYKRTSPTGFFIQWRSSVYITYIMCPSDHLTSARFEHFVCHRYICGIYFRLSVQCL